MRKSYLYSYSGSSIKTPFDLIEQLHQADGASGSSIYALDISATITQLQSKLSNGIDPQSGFDSLELSDLLGVQPLFGGPSGADHFSVTVSGQNNYYFFAADASGNAIDNAGTGSNISGIGAGQQPSTVSGPPVFFTYSGTTWHDMGAASGFTNFTSGAIYGSLDGNIYIEDSISGPPSNITPTTETYQTPSGDTATQTIYAFPSATLPDSVTYLGPSGNDITYNLQGPGTGSSSGSSVQFNGATYNTTITASAITPNSLSLLPTLNVALETLQQSGVEALWIQESGGSGIGTLDGLTKLMTDADKGTLTMPSGIDEQSVVNAAATVMAYESDNGVSGRGDVQNINTFNSFSISGSDNSSWKLDGSNSDDGIQQYFNTIAPVSFKGDAPTWQTLFGNSSGAGYSSFPGEWSGLSPFGEGFQLGGNLYLGFLSSGAIAAHNFEQVGGIDTAGPDGPLSSKWITLNALNAYISGTKASGMNDSDLIDAEDLKWLMENWNGPSGQGISQMTLQDVYNVSMSLQSSGSEGFQEGGGGGNGGDCGYLSTLNAISQTTLGSQMLAHSITYNPDGTFTVDFAGDPTNPITVTESDIAHDGNPFAVGSSGINIILAALNKDTSFLQSVGTPSGVGPVWPSSLFPLLLGKHYKPYDIGTDGTKQGFSGIVQFLTEAAPHVGTDMALTLTGDANNDGSLRFDAPLSGGHCCEVTNIDLNGASGGTITYENPWNNTNSIHTISVDELASEMANNPNAYADIAGVLLSPSASIPGF